MPESFIRYLVELVAAEPPPDSSVAGSSDSMISSIEGVFSATGSSTDIPSTIEGRSDEKFVEGSTGT